METLTGIIIIQMGIALVTYFLAKAYNFQLRRILVGATCLSIIWPILTVNIRDIDVEFLNTVIQAYPEILVNEVIGIVAGVAVAGIGDVIWQRRN